MCLLVAERTGCFGGWPNASLIGMYVCLGAGTGGVSLLGGGMGGVTGGVSLLGGGTGGVSLLGGGTGGVRLLGRHG